VARRQFRHGGEAKETATAGEARRDIVEVAAGDMTGK
jgi:hypothetical protein